MPRCPQTHVVPRREQPRADGLRHVHGVHVVEHGDVGGEAQVLRHPVAEPLGDLREVESAGHRARQAHQAEPQGVCAARVPLLDEPVGGE